MPNTIFLRLEGPMQSWGERAMWSVRDTAPEPTKSGVIGLLGCALGLWSDEDLRKLSCSLRMGVRCDQPGIPLIDYHTIVGGVLAANGKVKLSSKTKEPETVVTWRTYLCDASFLVALQGDAELISRLEEALENPTWPVYLGRKSCPPSRPVFDGTGEFDSLESALIAKDCPAKAVRVVLECEPGHGIQRRDELVSNKMRTFRQRYTEEKLIQAKEEAH